MQFTYTCVYLLHAYIHGSRKFRQGERGQAQYFPGVPNSGGVTNFIFSIEIFDFSGWKVRTSCFPHPLHLRMTFRHVSLCKTFKSRKKENVADSQFSKDIGSHGHLKYYVAKMLFLLHSFLEVPLVTTKMTLR